MEALTRLVTESLVRHGFDRPLDYRRLHWSRWFRCESHHSLLFVPSKPGVFAVAEEIAYVATGASPVPPARSAAEPVWDHLSQTTPQTRSRIPEAGSPRRMLAVTQFFEDDDMAFILDRMLSRENPMRSRLVAGRYFVRFVVIEDQAQRRSICSALNQWMADSAEKATGIGSHFASSLELTPATEYVPQSNEGQGNLFGERHNDGSDDAHVATAASAVPRTLSEAQGSGSVEERRFSAASNAPQQSAALAAEGRSILDSGAATNIHCPSPFPSGF